MEVTELSIEDGVIALTSSETHVTEIISLDETS